MNTIDVILREIAEMQNQVEGLLDAVQHENDEAIVDAVMALVATLRGTIAQRQDLIKRTVGLKLN